MERDHVAQRMRTARRALPKGAKARRRRPIARRSSLTEIDHPRPGSAVRFGGGLAACTGPRREIYRFGHSVPIHRWSPVNESRIFHPGQTEGRQPWLRPVDFSVPSALPPDQQARLRKLVDDLGPIIGPRATADLGLSLDLKPLWVRELTWRDAHPLPAEDGVSTVMDSATGGEVYLILDPLSPRSSSSGSSAPSPTRPGPFGRSPPSIARCSAE